MYPVLVQIGHFTLRSYGALFALAMLVGWVVAKHEARRKGFPEATTEKFLGLAVLAGLVGARLDYILFSDLMTYLRHPGTMFALWQGGLAVQGGLIGGLVAAVWFTRHHRLPFWSFADAFAPGLILGQAIGRLACFLNGDAYGQPTTLAWGVTFTDHQSMAPLNIPLHPTQLYEMGWNLLLFGFLWGIRKRTRYPGQLFLFYVAFYSLGRFVIEGLRGDQLTYALGDVTFSTAKTISLVAIGGSIFLHYYFQKIRGKTDYA
jgi:phosphatidylglycerol:prolipoprotein diacylglycerol transferase